MEHFIAPTTAKYMLRSTIKLSVFNFEADSNRKYNTGIQVQVYRVYYPIYRKLLYWLGYCNSLPIVFLCYQCFVLELEELELGIPSLLLSS